MREIMIRKPLLTRLFERCTCILSDPLCLAPAFFILLGLYVFAHFPRLNFSIGDMLGADYQLSGLHPIVGIFVFIVRLYAAYLLVRICVLRHPLLPALLSGLLLYLCYFPVAWGVLGWLALVPVLCLVRSDAQPWRIYLSAWYAGLVFFWPALEWMRVAHLAMYATWALLASYCALYFPAAIWLIRRLDRRTPLPLILTVPLVWTGLEFARSIVLTGFSWYYLGHTQHNFLPMIQSADLMGAYGVSFLLAAANAWVFEFLFANQWFRDFFRLSMPGGSVSLEKSFSPGKWLGAQGIAVFILVAANLFYGFWRLEQNEFTAGPRLALLQGDLPQGIRDQAATTPSAARDVSKHYQALCKVALDQRPGPDLLVWPETSFYDDWWEVSDKLPPAEVPNVWVALAARSEEFVPLIARALKTNVLLGLNANVLTDRKKQLRYNSALFISPEGHWGPRYDKMHRVPFGEFLPFAELPFMKWLSPYDFEYSITPGEHFTRFKLGDYHFGVIICNEDTDPCLARRYSRPDSDGPAVDFILNISNDGWFHGSSEHEEHLAICRFRAIECRRAVARSVNMGVSAVIDGNGRVLAPDPNAMMFTTDDSILRGIELPESMTFASWHIPDEPQRVAELPLSRWSEFKKCAGVISVRVPVDHRVSVYAYVGDWLPMTCLGVVAGGFIWPARKRMAWLIGKK
jgi:apolipoprotein N-acyltransferase